MWLSTQTTFLGPIREGHKELGENKMPPIKIKNNVSRDNISIF